MFKDQRCYDQSFMNQEFPVAGEDKKKSVDMSNMVGCCPQSVCPTMCPPVMECPQERCCHRYICHEVPHVIPCNTRIINHHVYRHTFTPSYTCCEENEYSNVYEPRCC